LGGVGGRGCRPGGVDGRGCRLCEVTAVVWGEYQYIYQ
jgi:hypothetical protein